jgi:hypothetical protein
MLLAVLAGASFLLVGTIVGVRMLLLARRTRQAPETLLGAGLCALTFVTIPCVSLGFGLRLGPVWLEKLLFVVGLVPVIGFAAVLHAFTARVFRPGSRMAWGLVIAATLVAAIGTGGTVLSRFAAWEVDRVVSVHWTVMLVGSVVFGLAWSGFESLNYHRKMRLRLGLGLVDPVVCDRFFLWGFGGVAAVFGVAIVIGSLLVGWRVVNHPLPILGIAFAGFSLSISWWLAFLPPEAYLRHLRARVQP